jgi:hypothetical protein
MLLQLAAKTRILLSKYMTSDTDIKEMEMGRGRGRGRGRVRYITGPIFKKEGKRK